MTVARSVADVLAEHVTFEVDCIDRMYLNVYQPRLQHAAGVAWFFRGHRGHPFASSALMDPISKRFVAGLHRFCRDQGVPMVDFVRGQRKDDLARDYLAAFEAAGRTEGVLFVGRTQAKTVVFRTERRRNPLTGATYPWIVTCARPGWSTSSTATAVDADFGPFFLKFCSYFPYNAKPASPPWRTRWRCRGSATGSPRPRSTGWRASGWRSCPTRSPARTGPADTAMTSRCCRPSCP